MTTAAPPARPDEICVVVHAAPPDERASRDAAMVVARALTTPLADARLLLSHTPVTLPRRYPESEASALAARLEQAGATVSLVAAPSAVGGRCATHPSLEAARRCERCQVAICALCSAGAEGRPLCRACLRKKRRSRSFYRLRVAVLLTVLASVVLWAWRDISQRRERTSWHGSLTVGLVVLRLGPVDQAAIAALRERIPALAQQLGKEWRRYRSGMTEPISFVPYGPVDVRTGPPTLREDGWYASAMHSYALWRYLSPVDEAAGLAPRGLDARLYLVVRPPRDERLTVEGSGEQGGRIGIVEVELDESMVDAALFVAAHELFHTLGATDKYDETGRTLVPAGLAEPDRSPPYPQQYAEIMARKVPLSPTSERLPESIDELRVGAVTAREIGWLEAAP